MPKKAKKKEIKFEKKHPFIAMLKKHSGDIKVMQNGEEKSVKELTKESIESIKACSFDSVIPEEAGDVAKGKKVDFHATTHYSSPVYKLYELGVGSENTQTLVLTFDANRSELAFIPGNDPFITKLYDVSNLYMILKDAEKPLNKLRKWSEADLDSETEYDMFVMNIPNIVMLKNTKVKDNTHGAIFVNLIIQIFKGPRSINKLKKKDIKVDEMTKFIIKCSLEDIKNYGCNNVILPLSDMMAKDWYHLIDSWTELIKADEAFTKLVNTLNLTVQDSTGFAIISNSINTFEEERHKS